MSSEVQRWADRAQYHSAAMTPENRAPGGGTRPTVRLLNATPDPLGSLAALCGIYEGRVVRSLAEVTDDDRRAALKAMQETVLDGPLEAITFHFLVEGVTRAFTHQAVRNRFSFFAQESMRFAVVDDEQWVSRQAYPPSLARDPDEGRLEKLPITFHPRYSSQYKTPEDEAYAQRRETWDRAVVQAELAYKRLVDMGIPAEEARGLMPHSMTTRYHWVVSLRTLLGEAGKRLCTQAQFEWRVVMAEIVKALRGYHAEQEIRKVPGGGTHYLGYGDRWQFEAMADLLQPVCYQEGHCGFMAKFDRGCTIRERVNANAAAGRPSSGWHNEAWLCSQHATEVECGEGCRAQHARLLPIYPKEWLADPAAARTRPGGANPPGGV